MATYYVTTSIPYVNGTPHLGHALEFVQADVLARYHRLRGDETRFQTGTDDNALKNVRAAEAAGLPTQAFVDRNAAAFAALRGPLALSFDDFIRTSNNPAHAAGAAKLWARCAARGDIAKRTYEGLYCVGCEQFYSEDELVDGLCPEHRRPPELVAEENYFFRLSHYADRLHDLIASGALRIVPAGRRAEILRFIAGGLRDFSISRSRARARGWGIPVPGDPEQVMYVWWDALINYLTALDFANDGPEYRRFWRDGDQRVHVIGKGIGRFHAVYWPAMLLSAGLPLPTTIYVHEYVTVDGQKIGKSLGNAIDPTMLTARFGTDPLRYWLLRDVPRAEDGDFTLARLAARANSDLANGLGNLLQRTLGMIARWCDGHIPSATEDMTPLHGVAATLPAQIEAALDRFDFRAALAAIWGIAGVANRYVDDTAPWILARSAASGNAAAARDLDTVLAALAEALRLIGHHLAPFLPGTSARILAQLGDEAAGEGADAATWGDALAGRQIQPAGPLFPRIELAADEE